LSIAWQECVVCLLCPRHELLGLIVQVFLAIRGGYVSEKSQTASNKTGIFGPN
jgi:hypothetical protein